MWVTTKLMDTGKNIQKFHNLLSVIGKSLTLFGLSFIERSNRTSVYQVSHKRLLYGVLISLFVLFVFYQQIIRYPKELNNLVLILLYFYMAVVGTLMAIAMIGTAAFNAPALARLLNNPEYEEIFGLDAYSFVKLNSLEQFTFSTSLLVGCYIADFIASGNYTIGDALGVMMFFFFPMYNSICIDQFFNYHYWLQRWYWNVNDGLDKLLNDAWHGYQKVHVLSVLEMSHLQFGIENKLVQEDNTLNVDLVMAAEIIRLRRLYLKTHCIAQEINSLYSMSNVLLLIHHCALEIVYTYWGLRHTLEDLKATTSAILNFYKAAFMSFVSVVSMVWPCTTTRVEAKRTFYLVEDLLAKVKHAESREELQIFSLLLLQEPYEFAPHGFFDMDTKLLLSLLAAVTSYLVVLLQYHMMYIALKANKNSLNIEFVNNTFTDLT